MIEGPIIDKISKNQNKVNQEFAKDVLNDYWLGCVSREVSLLGRREVLTGKAKFGILGDGKEVPQLALAKVFQKGDWRSGYYRDQTLMFALAVSSIQEFFAQLYSDPDNDPFSGGRQMNAHFATPNIKPDGEWVNTLEQYNTSSDISSTGGQMARGLGLAFASKMFRKNAELSTATDFSKNGNEVVFMTIGDASTSEGIFWETINAAGVLQVPMVLSVWDDGYGISVPKKYQTTKGSISEVLKGFQRDNDNAGWEIKVVKGHDYAAVCQAYEEAAKIAREKHIPVLVHVEELTQPQGHSTSGSHERYKSKERLAWEAEHDCMKRMGEWMVKKGIADKQDLEEIGLAAKKYAKEEKDKAWKNYSEKPQAWKKGFMILLNGLSDEQAFLPAIDEIRKEMSQMLNPAASEIHALVRKTIYCLPKEAANDFRALSKQMHEEASKNVSANLYAEGAYSALQVPSIAAEFNEESSEINGYQILNKYFDQLLAKQPNVLAFGEDVGHIGDVNQGFAGLQKKYGEERVFDTGIREWTIMGQAIGLSMRGFKPIAEIQYLDYLIYGLEPLSDDLASLRYRTNNIQCAPAIIRTRGHRLEGIWHAGSPMGMLINSLRGIYICV